MTLVSIVNCDKTLLALELVVDLSPMRDAIVEPLALLDPRKEGWEISSVESDFAESVNDDFITEFIKKWLNHLKIFYFLFVKLTISMRF